MAIYDYKCNSCGYLLENMIVAMSKRDDNKLCPNCNKLLKRLPPLTAAPRFTGSGFYETDYRVKNKQKD